MITAASFVWESREDPLISKVSSSRIFTISLFFLLNRMIQNDSGRNSDCKQVDMDNLFRVVQFCENVTECRRVQLLHYFGEMDFDPSQCRSRPDSMCDTCASSGSFVYKDITSEAKVFVESVNCIVHNGNRNWRKPVKSFTLNHFIDIFKVQYTSMRNIALL